MSLNIPKCNNFQIQNQNPYYVVFCTKEKRLVMTDYCQAKCNMNGTNPNTEVFFKHGSFHIKDPINTQIQVKEVKLEQKRGLDLFLRKAPK